MPDLISDSIAQSSSHSEPRLSELEQNLTLIEHAGKKIYLIGTAHISRKSAELVRDTILQHAPDTVCIELCDGRHETLSNPERWKQTDIYQIIRTGRAYILIAQLALAGFQKKLGDQLDMKPGDEMREAIKSAAEVDAEISLIDRDIRTTLKRAWGKTSLWTMSKMFGSVIGSLFITEEIGEEEIEKLKQGSGLQDIMGEFAEHFPSAKDVLIDERDSYMAEKIARSPGATLVAVVGAAHVPGIKRKFGSTIDLAELETLPPAKKSIMVLGWGVPLLIVSMIAYGFVQSGLETSTQMLIAWILANGALAALGATIALAHPLTIVVAFLAAPLASLNPMIGTGWICGLTEAILRKPRVVDLETVGDDILTLRGLWRNRVSKILLIVVLSTIGSLIGTVIGASRIASLL